MGIQTDIRAGVETIFSEMSEILISITYRENTGDVIVAGGQVTPTYTDHTASAIRTGFSAVEKQNETVSNDDIKLLLKRADLTFTPKTKGRIVMPNGDIVHVLNVTTDPTDSIYTLQVRA
jgi:hypothetical protein